MKKFFGFTLIEISIALIIVAVLTAIATVTYVSQVRKSRRVDAINTITSISLAEERYRSTNTLYGTLAQVWDGVSASAEGFYTLSITNVTGTTYTITATATGNQANDIEGSTACSSLALAMSSGTVTKTPAACWPS